jgi:hypothetical protein
MKDPFADIPAAVGSECEVRAKTWGRGKPRCDVASKPKRKKTDFSPMQRRWFEANGWTYARVEHANAWGAMTVDLWSFGDWLACKPGEGILIVQTCSGEGGNASARLQKAAKAPELAVWLASGGRFEVHSWLQPGGPGTKWENTVRPIAMAEEPKGNRGKR